MLTHSKLRKLFGVEGGKLEHVFNDLWLRSVDKKDFLGAAQANTAFNYANLSMGLNGGFIELAHQVNDPAHLISEEELRRIANSLNFVVTEAVPSKLKLTTH